VARDAGAAGRRHRPRPSGGGAGLSRHRRLDPRAQHVRSGARAWPDESWRGWWGEEPPYHTPVFVLTHHHRAPLDMKGGTVFHFVTDGIEAALEQAKAAAGGKDVRIGGGVSTVRQYLQARLIDELHLAVRPVLLGTGEALFQGLDWRALGYECSKYMGGERAAHIFL